MSNKEQTIKTKEEYINSLSKDERKRYYKIAMQVANKKIALANFKQKAMEHRNNSLANNGNKCKTSILFKKLRNNIKDINEIGLSTTDEMIRNP